MMGFLDFLKVNDYKIRVARLEQENTELIAQLDDLHKSFPPEALIAENLNKQIKEAQVNLDELLKNKIVLNNAIVSRAEQIKKYDDEINALKQKSLDVSDALELQSFGFYEPQYNFKTAEAYKIKLEAIREAQKAMIKNGEAVYGNKRWTVNGSSAQGRKMVHDMQKLLLRAFNGECDSLVDCVKYNNFDLYKKRIYASAEAVSKLGAVMDVNIVAKYTELKIQELTLAYEYAQKKQEEKEAQKQLREETREQLKLQKEIEEARRNLNKDRDHYLKAIEKTTAQINNPQTSEDDRQYLADKLFEYQLAVEKLNNEIKQVDYREANQKAGYVYIISNIGAFGENIYKIGMTRRLDPQDRIDELGDASVPFGFDIHAMIFSNDAPALEAELHKKFDNRKLNMINPRREFFNVSLDDIKSVVYEYIDHTIEFIDYPDAEQYRQSNAMRSNIINTPPIISEE